MKDIHNIIATADFSAIGVAGFELLENHRDYLNEWLRGGMHAGMGYMERSADIRHDLRNVFPDVKSVIVTLTAIRRVENHTPRIAAYAHNFRDYHTEIKNKLHVLLGSLKIADPGITGRAIVDSAPAFEKAWAVKAGLGWIGKNSLLINPTLGSFVHIGMLLVNKKIDASPVIIENGCPEGCGLCMIACPNGAINDNRTIDARKCIACYTLEKCDTPIDTKGYILGCDICMEACPYNKSNVPIKPIISEDWSVLSNETFALKYRGSSVERVGLERIRAIVEKNNRG